MNQDLRSILAGTSCGLSAYLIYCLFDPSVMSVQGMWLVAMVNVAILFVLTIARKRRS